MSRDIAQVTLEMLHKLEDFETAILGAVPESSRDTVRAQTKQVELGNMRGCIHALRNSIRVYRGMGSGQHAKTG